MFKLTNLANDSIYYEIIKMEKEELKKLVDKNYSINEIGKEFNLSYTSIRYYLNKFNLKTNGYKTEHDWSKKKS